MLRVPGLPADRARRRSALSHPGTGPVAAGRGRYLFAAEVSRAGFSVARKAAACSSGKRKLPDSLHDATGAHGIARVGRGRQPDIAAIGAGRVQELNASLLSRNL